MFKKATKDKCKGRLAICGVSGSGKTFTALRMATAMGKKVAVIDTERGSASKYADQFSFDVCDDLPDFSPKSYIDAITVAEQAGYDVILIDSLSHAWMGRGGALEMVDTAAAKGGNSYTAWRNVTPWHNKLIDAMLGSPAHIIVTMRSKSEYVMEDKKGKAVPKKVGMAPIQRDGMEYEFDVVGDLDLDHTMLVSKTRCPALDGKRFQLPGEDVAKVFLGWLNSGEAPKPTIKKAEPPKPTTASGKPASGSSATIGERVTKCIGAFLDICITDDMLETKVGKPSAEWGEKELMILNRFYREQKELFNKANDEAALAAKGGE